MYVTGLGIEPATQVCVWTRNQTHNPSATGQYSNTLSHTGQGYSSI